jgi:sulfite oxidase
VPEEDAFHLECLSEQVGGPGYLDGPADIHRVENAFREFAVSLHLYSRPFPECDVYDAEGTRKVRMQLKYYSIGGRRVCEGEMSDAASVPDATASEEPYRPKPYGKHPALHVLTEQPFNASPPLSLLRENFVTPRSVFFVRNHAAVPEIDPTSYRLTVTGMVTTPLELALADLRSNFEQQRVMATLQCAGNRRTELYTVAPIAGEVPWGPEAISNATWGGVRLRDVINSAGISGDPLYAAFTALDHVEREGKQFGFGGSVPIEKALSPEVVLAYEMNGEPLPPVHGGPLRLIIPGLIGARSVKWIGDIHLQKEPSNNFFQAKAYRLFHREVTTPPTDIESGMMLEEVWVNTVICSPLDGARFPPGPVTVEGYSLSSGGHTTDRVDVYVDYGQRSITEEQEPIRAELIGDRRKWAWCFWRATVDLKPGARQIVAHARDSAAHTQPKDPDKVWNLKGYLNNAWHRVRVRMDSDV